ncbi:MAG: glycosyltransferase [Paramuribaculum sp.]|nr:glycosyltransferase [Paramuribaculum sp.]
MKLLIITNVFHPSNMIGAFRINAFARYFSRAGHDVTVIAEGARDTEERWEGCDVRYVSDPIVRNYSYLSSRIYDGRWSLRRVAKALEYRLTLNSALWSRKALAASRRAMAVGHFDVVLSTGGHSMVSHRCALKLKREFPEVYWIADMRDELRMPIVRYPIALLHRLSVRRLKKAMRMTLDLSDLLLSVSKPIVDDLRRDSSHGRVLEICNGYDYPEVYGSCFQEKFTMMYLGRFYPGIYPDNLFAAYVELIDEGRLPADCVIKIVGNPLKIDIPDALRSNVVELPIVDHDEAVRMSIEECDALLMIYSRRAGRKGVYSGKLLDYLATNKPILAISDPGDVVGDLMRDTGAGYAVDEDDIPAIKSAVMECYDLWLNRRAMPRDWDRIKEFRRSRQVGILLDYLAENMPGAAGRAAYNKS